MSALNFVHFQHPIALQGLVGSGKTAVSHALRLSPTHILNVPESALTNPPADDRRDLELEFQKPQVFYAGTFAYTADQYGGRQAWNPHAGPLAPRAIVLVVDSCNRAVLTPPTEPLPPLSTSFLQGLRDKFFSNNKEHLAALRARMNVKQMLGALLQQRKLEGLPLLVLANKQDKEGAMKPEEIAKLLDLAALDGVRDWRIAGCNALTGDGLAEAVQWLNVILVAPTNFKDAAAAKKTTTNDTLTLTASGANTTTEAALVAAAKAAAALPRPVVDAATVAGEADQPKVTEGATVPRAA